MLPALLLSMLLCAPREMRVTFYTLGEGTQAKLTKMGNHPLPFRTAAVGDRRLLGRWLYVQDLGGWVYASDTGRPCHPDRPGPCLRKDSIDIFIGEEHMQPHARRLGVQYWTVGVCSAVEDERRPR
jgi:hypothetical protein